MNLSRCLYELGACFILGGIPCWWAYETSGVEGLTNVIKAIDTSGFTVYYFFTLAALHFIISIIGYLSPRWLESVKAAFHSLYPLLNRVGDSLLCLYRIIAGSMIGCSIIGITYYPVFGELSYSIIYLVLSIPFIWACVAFNSAYEYALGKQV